MRVIKRIYHDRQPMVGDTIECTHTTPYGDYSKGNEMTVLMPSKYLTGNQIYVLNHRTGNRVVISDGFYRIFTDITYVKTGEQHIVKRFLGIPFYRKTIDIYEEELTHD